MYKVRLPAKSLIFLDTSKNHSPRRAGACHDTASLFRKVGSLDEVAHQARVIGAAHNHHITNENVKKLSKLLVPVHHCIVLLIAEHTEIRCCVEFYEQIEEKLRGMRHGSSILVKTTERKQNSKGNHKHCVVNL